MGRSWFVALLIVGCNAAVPVTGGEPPAGSRTEGVATTSTSDLSGTTDAHDDATASPASSSTTSSSTAGGETWQCGLGLTCEETGDIAPAYACDPVAQDCPRGEKCAWWATDGGSLWNGTRCVEAPTDPVSLSSTCTMQGGFVSGVDDCAIGTTCFWVEPGTLGGTGECVAYCDLDAPDCPGRTQCQTWEWNETAVCIPACDPLTTACPDGSNCVRTDRDFACLPIYTELGQAFALCEATNGCEAGLACVDAAGLPRCDSDRCCSPYCDLTAPTCPDGTACVPLFEADETPVGHEDLGFCGTPT